MLVQTQFKDRMKKLVLLAWLLLAFATTTFAQNMMEYEGEGYSIQYPQSWSIEEVSDEGLVKFSSPDEEGIFQVIISDADGRSAMECLDDWIERTGYNSESEDQLSDADIESYGAEDGASGMFEPTVDGVDIFMNVDIYIRNGLAYFVIATTSVNDDHGYVRTMGTMAGSFGLHDR
jgi:hypothetical protein